MSESVDYLIEGIVITMDAQRRIIRDGAVAVRKSRIVEVGSSSELKKKYTAEQVLGGPRRFVTPGFIDCHNHMAQALVREYALEDYPNIYRVWMIFPGGQRLRIGRLQRLMV